MDVTWRRNRSPLAVFNGRWGQEDGGPKARLRRVRHTTAVLQEVDSIYRRMYVHAVAVGSDQPGETVCSKALPHGENYSWYLVSPTVLQLSACRQHPRHLCSWAIDHSVGAYCTSTNDSTVVCRCRHVRGVNNVYDI